MALVIIFEGSTFKLGYLPLIYTVKVVLETMVVELSKSHHGMKNKMKFLRYLDTCVKNIFV